MDGISLIQVADGALAEVQEMLNRITELSVQASNDTNTPFDRMCLQNEISEINKEITRIGKTTEFNTMPIFDDMFGEEIEGSVTNLVASPAADTGHLTEAYEKTPGSAYFPAASIDFSNINSSNLDKLNNQGFSFTCSQACSEVFDITFHTDDVPSSARNLSGSVTHYYDVNIAGCTSGAEIVNRIYDYVSNHLPSSAGGTSTLGQGVKVSHSNNLIADGNKIWVVDNSHQYSSASGAESRFKGSTSKYGGVDCSELTSLGEVDKINNIHIQCSSNPDDNQMIHTHRMNAELIGTSGINVSTYSGAQKGITKADQAREKISMWRAELGAFQNRLEHSFANVQNTGENTQAAESRLRDADMANEMVDYSMQNVLMQAGQSMISQANRSKEGVLALLT